jgi:hypothetical protein
LLDSEGGGREVIEGVVRAFLVVGEHPVVDVFADLGERAEEVSVEDFGAEGAIEALDVGVLGGFAGLDVVEADAVGFAPGVVGVVSRGGRPRPARCSSVKVRRLVISALRVRQPALRASRASRWAW